MRHFDFYEFSGILVPGAAVLLTFGLVHQDSWPRIRDAFSVGDFGVFLISAYVIGHLLQGVGNIVENAWWKLRGGMPTDWVRTGDPHLITIAQVERLRALAKARFTIDLPDPLSGLPQRDWRGIVRQIEAYLRTNATTLRSDVFNGNYGLSRGLAAAFLVNLILALPGLLSHEWRTTTVCASLFALSLYRTDRFGQHYARALLIQFLETPPKDLQRQSEPQQGGQSCSTGSK